MSYIGTEPSYGVFQRQVLTGDGSTTQFNLDYPAPQATSLLVSLDGIIQEPEYSYDVAISNGQPVINFSAAPDASGRVFIVYMGRQLLTSTPANTETHIDEFNGDGSTTAFTLTKTPAANTADNFVVFVDNVYQRLGASYAYTVSGETLTFSAAPPSGTNNIQVIQLNGSNTINTVADGTITAAKIQDGQVTAAKLADEYVDQTSATGSAELPVGTTAQRDGSPQAGMLRFNSDTGQFEGYDGTAWGEIAGGGSGGLETNFLLMGA